ncbi:hypothetical protein NFI96_018877 [Prochilodus magdalenae]|nr:hypothetical protein NFI96_018877 [Prochilodus magdalenae]
MAGAFSYLLLGPSRKTEGEDIPGRSPSFSALGRALIWAFPIRLKPALFHMALPPEGRRQSEPVPPPPPLSPSHQPVRVKAGYSLLYSPLTLVSLTLSWYHTGSLAFGSLILSIVQVIRVLLEYLEQKLKVAENRVAKFFLSCLKCCFWCLEQCIRFLNRNAYIMLVVYSRSARPSFTFTLEVSSQSALGSSLTCPLIRYSLGDRWSRGGREWVRVHLRIAIYGKNFCTSAKEAFFLLMRNIIRVSVLDKVTDFLLFLGKLLIVGIVGICSFFFFSGKIKAVEEAAPSLNYYWVPILTLVFGSYLIAHGFFSVYAMCVDTLFLCFCECEDLERNDGSPERPYFMSPGLHEILSASKAEEEADHGPTEEAEGVPLQENGEVRLKQQDVLKLEEETPLAQEPTQEEAAASSTLEVLEEKAEEQEVPQVPAPPAPESPRETVLQNGPQEADASETEEPEQEQQEQQQVEPPQPEPPQPEPPQPEPPQPEPPQPEPPQPEPPQPEPPQPEPQQPAAEVEEATPQENGPHESEAPLTPQD